MKVGNLEVYGVIYKITNKVNGKVYIGQTAKSNGFIGRYDRKGNSPIEKVYNKLNGLNGGGHDLNKHLLNAILKYGLDKFDVIEVFDIAFSKQELDIKEITYICLFDSFKNGYNRNLGGCGNKGHLGLIGIDNPTSKRVVQCDLDGNYIKTWNYMTEASESLGISVKYISRVCNKEFGRKTAGGFTWVFEDEYLVSGFDLEHYLDKGNAIAIPVIKLSLNGVKIKEYKTISDAIKDGSNLRITEITRCCQDKRKSHGGYIWVYKENYREDKIYTYNVISDGKPKRVYQLDLNGKIIRMFEKISDANEYLGVDKRSGKITSCCKGRQKTAYGYKWEYAD